MPLVSRWVFFYVLNDSSFIVQSIKFNGFTVHVINKKSQKIFFKQQFVASIKKPVYQEEPGRRSCLFKFYDF